MYGKQILRLWCLLTFFKIAFVYCLFPILGPADINFKQALQCENPEKYSSYATIEKRKINRTHAIYIFNGNLDVDLDETVDVYLNVAKWGDGGYKPNFFTWNDTNACEALFKYQKDDATKILKMVGRPPKCPIRAIPVNSLHYSVDHSKLRVDVLYGDYKVLTILFKGEKLIFCIEVYGEATPKKSW